MHVFFIYHKELYFFNWFIEHLDKIIFYYGLFHFSSIHNLKILVNCQWHSDYDEQKPGLEVKIQTPHFLRFPPPHD